MLSAKANGINVEENGDGNEIYLNSYLQFELNQFFIENLMALIASIDSFPRNMEFARNGSVSLSNRVILFKKVIVNFHS